MHVNPFVFLYLPVIVFAVVVHETAHGLMALWCGDGTARERGRLTLNPLPHVDLFGSILLPGLLALARSPFLFGWAKPVPVDWGRLRDPRNDPVKVALAGPAANLLLALACAGLLRALLLLPDPLLAAHDAYAKPVVELLLLGVMTNCALALFNLIPIPPLDGSWVLMRFLPLRHVLALHQFRLLGLGLVVVLWSTPLSRVLFDAPLHFLVRACLGVFAVPGAKELL